MPTTPPRPALNLCQILHLKHRRFAVVAVAAAAVALAAFALMEAGAWLVLEDPLQPADAIVVLGGGAPFRAMEAAKLYNQGWAHQVWLTQGSRLSDLGPARLRIDRSPEHIYSGMVLEHLGVPGTAIRMLSGGNDYTAHEVRTIARELTQSGGDRAILVTSSSTPAASRSCGTLWLAVIPKRSCATLETTHSNHGGGGVT